MYVNKTSSQKKAIVVLMICMFVGLAVLIVGALVYDSSLNTELRLIILLASFAVLSVLMMIGGAYMRREFPNSYERTINHRTEKPLQDNTSSSDTGWDFPHPYLGINP